MKLLWESAKLKQSEHLHVFGLLEESGVSIGGGEMQLYTERSQTGHESAQTTPQCCFQAMDKAGRNRIDIVWRLYIYLYNALLWQLFD